MVHDSVGYQKSMAPTSASDEGRRKLPLMVEGEGKRGSHDEKSSEREREEEVPDFLQQKSLREQE